MYTLGVNPRDVLIPSSIEAGGTLLALGTRAVNQDGNEYILLESAAAITLQGLAVTWNAAFVADDTTTADAAQTEGRAVALTVGLPTAAGQRFWCQRAGVGPVRVLATTTGNAPLATSATAGRLSSTITANKVVLGVQIFATSGGAESTVNGILSYPVLSRTA